MSAETHYADQPPSYDDSAAAPHHDPTLMQEPIMLVLDGQSIRGGQSADSPALYETDRGVANLGHATTTVELTRIERTVQNTATPTLTEDDTKAALGEEEKEAGKGPVSGDATAPRIKIRKRHIFNLVHPTGNGGTTAAAETAVGYYMKPWTKTTHAGTYGLKKKSHHLRAADWKVLPVREKAKDGEPRFEDKGQPLFQVAKGKSGGAYEWMDAEGVVLAVEEEDGEEEGGRRRLRMVEGIESRVMDALVAMWCCRIWAEAAEAQPQMHEGGMEKVRRLLRPSKEFPSSTTNNIINAAGV